MHHELPLGRGRPRAVACQSVSRNSPDGLYAVMLSYAMSAATAVGQPGGNKGVGSSYGFSSHFLPAF